MPRRYFDHNATTPVHPSVRAAMDAALAEGAGNPSSVHAEGRAARGRIEAARRQVAGLLAAEPDEIVFTSGGTEADCLGIFGLARLGRERGQPPVVLAAATEHPAVAGAAAGLAAEGFTAATLAVDGDGRLDLGELEAQCRQGAAAVAVALANHELGTLQDVTAAAAIAHAHGALLHCDAVQAAGKLPLRAAALGADTLALSAHKIGGPSGAGALWIRSGLDLPPLCAAGHQERGRRPGTENVAGAVGLGVAATLAAAAAVAGEAGAVSEAARVAALATRLEDGLRALPGVSIHGGGAPRVGNTVNAGIAGALGEVVVAALDLAGFSASTGAACTSGSVAPSPVLLALGLAPERAAEAVRFSLGRGNTVEDVDALLDALPPIIERARRFR
jgi:cysteine desulfurase